MVRLTRTVRFAVPLPGATRLGSNGCAGNPPVRGLTPFYELDVHCKGDPDPTTGYLINIKSIDAAVRKHVLPLLAETCAHNPGCVPALLLPDMLAMLQSGLPVSVDALTWRLSPYDALQMTAQRPEHAVYRRRFDFAASHRLFVKGWSEEANRQAFGKCSHPSGHGHNYEIEPAVEFPLTTIHPETGDALEALVDESIIQPFDHKHLNIDTEDFGPKGVNPSVENIAMVCFERLQAAMQQGIPEARLISMTVWETPRTSATYPPV
jgi:6-pyruvoyltetrahydropterin/6-carboxytetrahydropterin synthase